MSHNGSPPTLKSLAALLGLSPATVSRVLSGQAERYRISAATRERILAKASACGLVLNHQARSLRLQKSFTLGLIIPDVANPFFALLARQVTRSARDRGYSVLLAESEEDVARERQALSLMGSRQVDGLILAPVGMASGPQHLQALGARPCVLVDRLLPGIGAPCVTSDHRRGALLATQHLLARGHRDIACVQGIAGTFANDARLAGWQDALRAARIPCDAARIVGTGYSIADGREAAMALFKSTRPPTAVLALGNLLALGVLEASRLSGIRIPQDVSLIAFDEQPWTAAVSPPLTTVAQPIEELGRRAFELLLGQIEQRAPRAPQHLTLPVELIERDSVQALRPARIERRLGVAQRVRTVSQ